MNVSKCLEILKTIHIVCIDHSRLFTVLFIIFLGCSAVAKESEKCDRVQFSSDDPKAIINNDNFTEQSFFEKKMNTYWTQVPMEIT